MKIMGQVLLTILLMLGASAAYAVEIESSTSVYLTFRECLDVDPPCSKFSRTRETTTEGLPGNTGAQAEMENAEYGSASGISKLTDGPGGAELSGRSSSLSRTRNGSNVNTLRKYTNTSNSEESLTYSGILTFEKTMPESAGEEGSSGAASSDVVGELGVIQTNVDSFDGGTTAEDNFKILMEGPEGVEMSDLGSQWTGDDPNVDLEGSKSLSVTFTVKPGESVWLWALVQNLAADGGEVSGNMITQLTPTAAE